MQEVVVATLAMNGVIAELDALEVDFEDARPFTNVNAPEDLLTIRVR